MGHTRKSLSLPYRGTSPTLAALPPDVLERILGFVDDVEDLASLNATARLFRGARCPRSPVERALRARIDARQHDHMAAWAVREHLSPTQTLLELERVWQTAWRHTSVVATSSLRCASAFVDACGGLHTCGELVHQVVEDSVCYAGELHILGLDRDTEDEPYVLIPRRVVALERVRITAVAMGHNDLLALSDAGAVYACGGNDHGQLGLGHTDDVWTPVRIDALGAARVVCIATGSAHSLALTAAGRVYSWGYGFHGELGHGDQPDQHTPKLIEGLVHTRIAGVAAGGLHSLALSTAGAVYSFGCGSEGCLGHGDREDQLEPKRISALSTVRVMHVGAAGDHSLVVDDAGGAHSFGFGGDGALGHGDETDRHTPTRIDALQGVRIVRACAGDGVSLLLDADGGVHACGTGPVLGQGGLTTVDAPMRVTALSGVHVVGAALSEQHALVVTSEGHAYSWGRVSAGLGLGRSGSDADEDERIHVPQLVHSAPILHCGLEY